MKVSVSIKPQELKDHPLDAGEHEHRKEAVYTGGPTSKQMSVSVSIKPQRREDNPLDVGEHEHRNETVNAVEVPTNTQAIR